MVLNVQVSATRIYIRDYNTEIIKVNTFLRVQNPILKLYTTWKVIPVLMPKAKGQRGKTLTLHTLLAGYQTV